jgi:hypothetical protein
MPKINKQTQCVVPSDIAELQAFCVTMDGKAVPQEWPPSDEYIGDDLSWEDLIPETLVLSNNTEFRIDPELRAA